MKVLNLLLHLIIVLRQRCLKQDNVTFTQKQVVDVYIVYGINLWPFNVCRDFALGSSLFGAVKLTKNADCYCLKMLWYWI